MKLFVPRGLTVSGRVVDLEKRPIPGAKVFRVNEAHHDLLQRIARADRAGEFRLRDVEELYAGRDVPRPADWGGYRLRPDHIEFWQGRAQRLHDRLTYRRKADGAWTMERLSP